MKKAQDLGILEAYVSVSEVAIQSLDYLITASATESRLESVVFILRLELDKFGMCSIHRQAKTDSASLCGRERIDENSGWAYHGPFVVVLYLNT